MDKLKLFNHLTKNIRIRLLSFLAFLMIMSLISCARSNDSFELLNDMIIVNKSSMSTSMVDVNTSDEPPEIQIITPLDGSQLQPDHILIALKINNFTISKKSMGEINHEGQGHLIYYLDENPPVNQGQWATTDTSITSLNVYHLWKDVKEGRHVLSVQLVNNDDTPLSVPVIATISIDVKVDK